MGPEAPGAGGVTPRERTGRWMRALALTVVAAPLALALLPLYLGQVRAGQADRWAPYSYAAVACGMLVLPFWALGLASLLAA